MSRGFREGQNRPNDVSEDISVASAPVEPIQSLAEATTMRQAMALFVLKMDFNGDDVLQKSEFVKGYNDVKDVAGKLFSMNGNGSSMGGDDFAPMGGPGFGPGGGPR